MKRRFDLLLDGPFDLLVIGGGIYGSWVACDAAMRGLRVALVEQEDWGAGTSSRSSKLIHGGLRYLEQRQFGLVRTSLEERSRLARLAPHRVKPLRFALPVYAGGRVGRFRLKAGLWLYDRMARHDDAFDNHETLSRRALLERYEFLESKGLRGGFTYADAETDDARLTLEVVAGAMHYGAVAVNRVRATELLHEAGRVAGARLLDRETEATIDVRAELTLNCGGPWIGKLLDGAGKAPPLARLSKGVHLVLPPLPTDDAMLLPTADGRVVFLIPWYGRTLLGTTDTDFTGSPGHPRVDLKDTAYLLAQANRCLADSPWEGADVIGEFAGLRALPATDDASPHTISREWSMVEPAEGLLVSVGGKLTSARADAAEAVDRVLDLLGREGAACPTGDRPLMWAPSGDLVTFRGLAISGGMRLGLDEETARTSASRYGRRVEELHEVLDRRPELARRIVPDAPFCLAEILVAVESEMARDLTDLLRRRVPLLLVSRVSRDALHEVADLAGEVLNWSDRRRRDEVDSVLRPHARHAPSARP